MIKNLLFIISLLFSIGASAQTTQTISTDTIRLVVPAYEQCDTIIEVGHTLLLDFPVRESDKMDYTQEEWLKPYAISLTHWSGEQHYTIEVSWPSELAVRFKRIDNTHIMFHPFETTPIKIKREYNE